MRLRGRSIILTVLAVVVAGLATPIAASADSVPKCTRSDPGTPGDPGTVVLRSGVVVATGTNEADRIEVTDDGGDVRVVTSFAGTHSFVTTRVEIFGCRGADTIDLHRLSGFVDIAVYGDAGKDTIDRATDGGYHVLIDGGSGADWIRSGDVREALTIRGGDGNDVLVAGDQGNGSNSSVDGGAGNDVITVGGSIGERWILDGGSGNDTIVAGDQRGEGPLIRGGNGNDTVEVGLIDFVVTSSEISGGSGRDTVTVAEIVAGREMVIAGGPGGDDITIGTLTAWEGLVYIDGGDAGDSLRVGDVIALFPGEVTVDGGPKRDTCTVGTGTVLIVNCED